MYFLTSQIFVIESKYISFNIKLHFCYKSATMQVSAKKRDQLLKNNKSINLTSIETVKELSL